MADGYVYKIKIEENGNIVLPSLIRNAQAADTSLNKLAKGGHNASVGITTLGNSTTNANLGLGKMKGLLASIGLTVGAGLIVKNLISTGKAYERSMSNVKAISNATEEEFVRLKRAAREAGAATVFSASEAADAMGYLAQAGFKTNQQIGAIFGTLDLASSGSLGLAEAANITAQTLSQFGMGAEKSTVIADQLSFTANNFNTNVTEIAEAMKYFGPIAHAFNMPLSEANAVIGLVANSGLKGSMATRALSTSLTRLAAPTKQMDELMSALNLSFFDAEGNFVGVAEMIGRVENAMTGFTMQEKQATLATLFGTEALKDMNPLISAGADEIRKWTNEIENAHGTAKRMAEIKLDNLHGDLSVLESEAEEFSLTLYEKMQPALRSITQDTATFISTLDANAIGSSLGHIAKGAYTLTRFIIDNKDAIINLGKVYITLKMGILGYNTTVRIATTLTSIMSKTIILSPWGLAAAGIMAAVSALALFRRRTEETTLANQGVIDSIYKERASVNLLSAELSKAETPLNRRKEIIEELKRISPGLVDGINAEAVAYSDLAKNVESYNRQKINEIVLEKKKGELANLQEAAASALMEREKAESSVPGIISSVFTRITDNIQLNKKLSGQDRAQLLDQAKVERASLLAHWEANKTISQDDISEAMQGFLGYLPANLNITRNSLEESRQNEERAFAAAENFTGSLNEYAEKIGNSLLGNKVSGDTTTESGVAPSSSSAIPGALSASESIVKGGSSQRIINITVEKFQDTVNNYLSGASGEISQQLDEFMDKMNEGFMRILNSANQLA